jgi:hypothetical protein
MIIHDLFEIFDRVAVPYLKVLTRHLPETPKETRIIVAPVDIRTDNLLNTSDIVSHYLYAGRRKDRASQRCCAQ